MRTKTTHKIPKSDNPDPITGEAGAHPVGTGVGAALAGAATGAAGGAVGGPVGAVIGAAVGAVAGGYAGKAIGEAIDPTAEDAYWRENFRHRPYIEPNAEYETYRPAYEFGWESRDRYPGRTFEDVEHVLAQQWRNNTTGLNWESAKPAVRDGWNHVVRDSVGTVLED